MSMNIKNKEAHQLANELAKLTGESMTEAVTKAVRERLDRVRKEKRKATAEELMEIARKCAAQLKEPYRSMSIDELLYDDKGLPK